MKKIIVGLTLTMSISAFADCRVSNQLPNGVTAKESFENAITRKTYATLVDPSQANMYLKHYELSTQISATMNFYEEGILLQDSNGNILGREAIHAYKHKGQLQIGPVNYWTHFNRPMIKGATRLLRANCN